MAYPFPAEDRPDMKNGLSFISRMREVLDVGNDPHGMKIENLPFCGRDTTAGAENEFQSCVVGTRDRVDLALVIEQSNYYRSIQKRYAAGETSKKIINRLESYLNENRENIWENSWVRFPIRLLTGYARRIFSGDLHADKRDSSKGLRSDVARFVFTESGEDHVRIPVSYLLKLSLAQAVSPEKTRHRLVRGIGENIMECLLNDNTSPEISSFRPVEMLPRNGMGEALAQESLLRYLLTQLLMQYANVNLELEKNGQEALIYMSPHPPIRQRYLNDCVSDSFYRELFMNPCLSGWDRGEDKYHYMNLCHRVLSRSQLNTIAKLREAGIITNNLVVLPNMSNISLANNGTHITLGSRKITALMKDPSSGYTPHSEKYLGDLAIKISEHFMPLFVGTYSAAPYRMDFRDFHPEKALGFLAHELQYTHLRMIWRRWMKKGRFKVLGHPLTPFGPEALDRFIGALFRFKGDFIPDFRLIDYLVAVMSTEQSPALDGSLGNTDRLKDDLAGLGIFDRQMSVYLLTRLRQFSTMGFSGFEGRFYSLFENLGKDMTHAANLQALITALAYRYMLSGEVTHDHIPDDVFLESERRQIFFGTAIGIPTFFVRKNTGNRFLLRILGMTRKTRPSTRYPDYIRVYNLEFRRALVTALRQDAADIIEAMGLEETVRDLEERISSPEKNAVSQRITKEIMKTLGKSDPSRVPGDEFNTAAERYYRNSLRKKHLGESLALLEEKCRDIEKARDYESMRSVRGVLDNDTGVEFLDRIRGDYLKGVLPEELLLKLLHLTIIVIGRTTGITREMTEKRNVHELYAPPVY